MDRAAKIRLVRAWLLLAAGLAVWLCWPTSQLTYCLVAPLFLFPNCVCCPSCECSYWTGNTTVPCSLQLDLAGTGNGGCSSCASFDGTWVLDTYQPFPGSSVCRWYYALPSSICSRDYITIFLNTGFGSNQRMRVRMDVTLGGVGFEDAYYEDFGSTPPDIRTFSAYSLANNFGTVVCDWTSGTNAVTAL